MTRSSWLRSVALAAVGVMVSVLAASTARILQAQKERGTHRYCDGNAIRNGYAGTEGVELRPG